MTYKPIKIILFHADWCGHCIDFMPEWKTMKSNTKAHKYIDFIQYEYATIKNLDNSIKTINGKQIDGFPTLKIIINDVEFNYSGNRNRDDIYKFVIDNLNIQKGGCGCNNDR